MAAEDPQPRSRSTGDGGGTEMAAYPGVVLEGEEDVVIGRAAAPEVDLAVDARDRSEQGQGLVDQMGAEVEQHSAALAWSGGLSPGLTAQLRSPPFEAR